MYHPVLGIIPNFYGFLNNMGVSAPTNVTRFYYFAYWVGLFVSGLFFWISCKMWPPAHVELSWREPKNYIRPEEEGEIEVLEAVDALSSPNNRLGEDEAEKRVDSKVTSL
jgi:nucleobase:cation symporter-1, NCS1 family